MKCIFSWLNRSFFYDFLFLFWFLKWFTISSHSFDLILLIKRFHSPGSIMRKCWFWRSSISMTFWPTFLKIRLPLKKIRFSVQSLYRTMPIICAAGLKNSTKRKEMPEKAKTRLLMRSTGWFGLTGEIEIDLKLRRKRRFPVESNFV